MKNSLFSVQYENFIFMYSYRIWKFHTYTRTRICGKILLSYIFVWRKVQKIWYSVKRKHTKTNKNMIFSVIFTNFCKTIIFSFSDDYWHRCWKESHSFQRTEDGIYCIRVNKLGFHFWISGCEIFERFLFSCNFGMFLFASLF